MRVLITGYRGFIGRHFSDHLDVQGHRIIGVDILDGTVCDCRRFFAKDTSHFDLVIHAAAVIPDVADRHANPLRVAENFSIDAEFFQWVMRAKPKVAVYFSSAAAYPIDLGDVAARENAINLDAIRQPDAMYGTIKLMGELQARAANAAGQVVIVVRPQSGYGTDQSMNYPFPSFIDRAKRREDPFEIWGAGTQVRDFVHVDDIVGAVMAMVRRKHRGPMNIGTGRGTTMSELATLVCNAAGYNPTKVTHQDKPSGATYHRADTTAMRKLYVPKVTLEEGIRRALQA